MATELSRNSASLVLTDHDIQRRCALVALEAADIARVRSLSDLLERNVDDYVTTFFKALERHEETAPLFATAAVLAEAKFRKREHLLASVAGEYRVPYAEQRIALAMLYGRAGLDVRVLLGAYHQLMKRIGVDVMARFAGDPADAFQRFVSLKKISFLDIGIIIDVLIAERERTIEAQRAVIRELSTPVLPLREHLLILPLIGIINSTRAQQLIEDLLRAIRVSRAKVVVLDITGVRAVDSHVARHLTQTVQACELMGAAVIVTGISAAVASILVRLGIDMTALNSQGDLRGGIEEAERMLGYRVVRATGTAPARHAAPLAKDGAALRSR